MKKVLVMVLLLGAVGSSYGQVQEVESIGEKGQWTRAVGADVLAPTGN